MTQEQFYQQAMIAAMQGLLSAIGNGYEDEYHDPHGYLSIIAHGYAKELTIRAEIELAEMRLENQFPETVI